MCRYTYLESQGKLSSYVCKRDCHEESNLHLCFFLSDLITYIILDEDECFFEDWIANLEKEAEIALLRFVFDGIFSSSTPWASLVSGMIVMDIRCSLQKQQQHTKHEEVTCVPCHVSRYSIRHFCFDGAFMHAHCLSNPGVVVVALWTIHKWRHPLKGRGGSAKRWRHSISLFSKMGDNGEGEVKNLKK